MGKLMLFVREDEELTKNLKTIEEKYKEVIEVKIIDKRLFPSYSNRGQPIQNYFNLVCIQDFQIDHEIHYLTTSANIKILICKDLSEYDREKMYIDNLYLAHSWEEVQEILDYFIEHVEFMTPCD